MATLKDDLPNIHSRWIHNRTGRECRIVGHRYYMDGNVAKWLVEYRYRNPGNGKTGPMQDAPAENFKKAFRPKLLD